MNVKELIAETDEEIVARALLVGLARIGVLSAGTPAALSAITEVAGMIDYRDEMPENFGAFIAEGKIQVDARWRHETDASLAALFRVKTVSEIARKGGSARSEKKRLASAANGRKSAGRPRKTKGVK